MLAATTVLELLDLQERVGPDVIFPSESHINKEKAQVLRVKLGFDFVHLVESDGRANGLALFCNKVNVAVVNFMMDNFFGVVVMSGSEVHL